MKRTPWLSWRLYFLTIPIDLIVLLLSSDHASTGSSDFSRWAILSFVAHGSIAPVVALTLFFTSKFQSWKTDLVALILLGIVRGLAINVGAAKVAYGKFIQATFSFLIIAFALFLIIKAVNASKKSEEPTPTPPAPPVISNEEKLLGEIRDLLKSKN